MTRAPTGRSEGRGLRTGFRVVFCLFLLLGCGGREESSRAVRDDLGREVSLPPRVTRVVTLAPNLTEIVFAVGAGERVVGTDDFSNDPAAAMGLPKVGGLQPNVEKIASLRPDLVLATTNGNHPNLAPALAAVSIPLFVVKTDRLDEIASAGERLGALLNGSRPREFVRDLRDGIERQKRTRARSPRILFAVYADPLYVAGRDTFSDDLFVLTGARNAVEAKGWPQYSLEALLADAPDIIIHPAKSVTREQIQQLFARTPELARKVTIETVDEDRFTRPGPRVVIAAEELNAIIDRWESKRD